MNAHTGLGNPAQEIKMTSRVDFLNILRCFARAITRLAIVCFGLEWHYSSTVE